MNLARMTRRSILLSAVWLCSAVSVSIPAQTFNRLHAFGPYTGYEGARPRAGVILSGDSLYGTAWTYSGGSGTIFGLNTNGSATDGTGFNVVFNFGGNSFNGFPGAYPLGGLTRSGNTLYGTASDGGYNGDSPGGTVFKVNTDGSGFAPLHQFGWELPNSGLTPAAGLVLSAGTLYGTTQYGGTGNSGTMFKVSVNGTGFSYLHNFTQIYTNSDGVYTNADGAEPVADLMLSGSTLYGTAQHGGASGNGTVFKLNVNGSGFTTLYSFSAFTGSLSNAPGALDTNNDGAVPKAGLILLGDTLYATTSSGGPFGNGTIFALSTNGTSFSNMYSFSATPGPGAFTNSDGASPLGSLISSDDKLYGTAYRGGTFGNGTVFGVSTNGMGFTNLYSFSAFTGYLNDYGHSGTNRDGANPSASLLLSGNTLYGTAANGGAWGNGTVFSLLLPMAPQLAITPYGTDVILTWSTNATGFTLQSTTNLLSSAAWNAVSPGPIVINGENVVISPASAAQQFYRLAHN